MKVFCPFFAHRMLPKPCCASHVVKCACVRVECVVSPHSKLNAALLLVLVLVFTFWQENTSISSPTTNAAGATPRPTATTTTECRSTHSWQTCLPRTPRTPTLTCLWARSPPTLTLQQPQTGPRLSPPLLPPHERVFAPLSSSRTRGP